MKAVRITPHPTADLEPVSRTGEVRQRHAPLTHSHSGGLLQEHDHEPVPGLPEMLPQGERILWQGAPRWQALAVEAFHLRKLTLYFAVLAVLRLSFVMEEAQTAKDIAKGMGPFLVLSISALLALWAVAWLSARHTLYTLTNRRVVMRIGIVLTVTFNIPFSRMCGAHLKSSTREHGDVAIEITRENRIPWLQLWPHARPWHIRQPQPVLRGISNAEEVAALLTRAWSDARGLPIHTARPSTPQPLSTELGIPAH